MKNFLIALVGLSVFSPVVASASTSEAVAQTSIRFTVADKDRPVKEVFINGKSYLRNFENHTIIIDAVDKHGNHDVSVHENDAYSSVRYNFDDKHSYTITIQDGPK